MQNTKLGSKVLSHVLLSQLNFAPLGGNRCDCAVVACAMMSLCDTGLPGDVIDVCLAVVCSPPKIADRTDTAKLGPPSEIPVSLRILAVNRDWETEAATRDWVSRSPEVRLRVELGDSVTQLPSEFLSCWSRVKLISVELPGGLQQVNDLFLRGCSSLTSVKLPDSLQEVSCEFLRGCPSLTSLELPDSLQEVGRDFMSECLSLTSLNLPDGLQRVGPNFLRGCTSLTSVKLPDSLQEVGREFLRGCSSLTLVKLPDSLQEVGRDFMSECSSLTSLNLPGGLLHVGGEFLRECLSLTSVDCPSHLARHLPPSITHVKLK